MTVTAHDHPEFLKHHFDTPAQQFEAGKLGMWLFLATEVLLFGGLFCAYSIWRGNHPDMFKYGSQFLNTTMGAINTAVLILSSLTMATAVTMAQRGKQKPMMIMLGLTLAGAVAFLVIKYFEYTHKFHEGWFPGMAFYEKPGSQSHTWSHEWSANLPPPVLVPAPDGSSEPSPAVAANFALPPAEASTVHLAATGPGGFREDLLEKAEAHELHPDGHKHRGDAHVHPLQDARRPDNAHMFFNIYFMMTGLHGIHVLLGIIMLSWLILLGARGRFSPAYFTPVDLGGLYWHIVDLIWIFLFPLFYLI